MHKIEISDQAMDFLKNNAIPFEDTHATVIDRLIQELVDFRTQATSSTGTGKLPPVAHTKVLAAKVADKFVAKPSWQHVLATTLGACGDKGANKATLLSLASLNEKTPGEKSSYAVPGMSFSFGGTNAPHALKAITTLSQQFSVPVWINMEWHENKDAAFPGEQRILEI